MESKHKLAPGRYCDNQTPGSPDATTATVAVAPLVVWHHGPCTSCILKCVHVSRMAPVVPAALGSSPAGLDNLSTQTLQLRQTLLQGKCVCTYFNKLTCIEKVNGKYQRGGGYMGD